MKRFFALILALLMLLSLTACGSGGDTKALEEELAQAKTSLAQAERNLARVERELEQAQQALEQAQGTPVVYTVHSINATINGNSSLEITQTTELTAVATLAEGQIIEGWKVNGQLQEGAVGEFLVFTAQGSTVVEAVVRQEKKLTTVTATIQFLDAKGKASGDELTEFVFEKDYVNPVTKETVPGGKISAQIKAKVPSGKVVDYWLINGVPYFYNTGVTSFIVEDLDETTVYEVVFKDKAITYYKVTCDYCSFNGRTSDYVAAGSTITVTGDGSISGYFVINGVRDSQKYIRSITLTINQDTNVEFFVIIN